MGTTRTFTDFGRARYLHCLLGLPRGGGADDHEWVGGEPRQAALGRGAPAPVGPKWVVLGHTVFVGKTCVRDGTAVLGEGLLWDLRHGVSLTPPSTRCT